MVKKIKDSGANIAMC